MDGSIQIPFEATAGGLIVRFANRDLVDRKPATFKALADLIKARQAKIVLADMRGIPGEATFLDRYELGEMAAHYLPRVTLGVLLRDEQVDRGQIGVMVAANRGMRIEIFTDAAAAKKWFEADAGAQPPA
jgi:hypothetical protein